MYQKERLLTLAVADKILHFTVDEHYFLEVFFKGMSVDKSTLILPKTNNKISFSGSTTLFVFPTIQVINGFRERSIFSLIVQNKRFDGLCKVCRRVDVGHTTLL